MRNIMAKKTPCAINVTEVGLPRLEKGFFDSDTVAVARSLLGTCLVHASPEGVTAGRIVETEAYLRDDPACHASRGKTERNAVMFGPPGYAYIYFIYGMHHCFNVVTAAAGIGEAVLIRALEPLTGIPLMERRRGTSVLKNLCNGPGKLVQAMGLTPHHNGAHLMRGLLTLHSRKSFGGSSDLEIAVSRRIGITKAAELPLRFWIKGNRFVSR